MEIDTNIKNFILKSVGAGILISMAVTVYLSCENKYMGSFLFSIGLISVCILDFLLYTSKIGYFFECKQPKWMYLGIWTGNFFGVFITCSVLRFAKPSLHIAATAVLESKLQLSLFSLAISAFFCGVCIYLAGYTWSSRKDVVGFFMIIICTMVFLLSGYEHCIADMCYWILGYNDSPQQMIMVIPDIIMISIFNGVGAIVARQFHVEKIEEKKE